MSDKKKGGSATELPVLERITSATIRFAGDSGDGMQLAGMRFTDASAMLGNDVATAPDYPAEIRAPAGSLAGVSGFQVNFASTDIHTTGDELDALIAMNPAALKANLKDVRPGGLVIVNETDFTPNNLRKAEYEDGYSPLDDDALTQPYRFFKIPITRLTKETLVDSDLGAKEVVRCRNMYALGLICWLYNRPLTTIIDYLEDYFGIQKGLPAIAEANVAVLTAGYHFGDIANLLVHRYQVEKADLTPGHYRRVSGNEAVALGLVAASKLAGKTLVYCSYPITPASDILHHLAGMQNYGVKTVQAEDEISAVCAAIGASYAGQIGCTGTSGPGLSLKSEALGLAVMTELPLVVIDVQRGGPSTGLPTKNEQSDLLQAMFGRNGDSPMVIMAASSPADCFDTVLEATRIALQHMVPVLVLSDNYIANGAEPWRLPAVEDLKPIEIHHPAALTDGETFEPFTRDENLVRPWALLGTPGLEHRIGGLEKEDISGNISYSAENHGRMTKLRRRKVERLAHIIPPLKVEGDAQGDLLVLGWGSTHGAITSAVTTARAAGKRVSSVHLRHINPFAANLAEILASFDKILIPEMNCGQLLMLIRSRYLVDARGLTKVRGQNFLIHEIEDAITGMLAGDWGERLSVSPKL
jgi:2-oxoglutarate ferredoxin oxidoreductase subunit alpha